MVSFELGKEIKKDVFSSCHERRTKKKVYEFFLFGLVHLLGRFLRCLENTTG